jgi:hypothetical protein
MNTPFPEEPHEAASANAIREIIGPFEDDVVAKILKVGPTVTEVRDAYAWLRSDEYLQRHLDHGLHGRAAQVFQILKDEYPELGDSQL